MPARGHKTETTTMSTRNTIMTMRRIISIMEKAMIWMILVTEVLEVRAEVRAMKLITTIKF